MNRKKVRTALCAALALAGLTVFGAMAAGGAGSQSDPLVTLSYLTDTFTAQIMDKVDALVAARNAQLAQELSGGQPAVSSAAPTYAAVSLAAGQTLYGEPGCEVILRSGAANCTASADPGLVDATTGGSIEGGAYLQQNHLYLMTDSRAVASAGGAVLLVRGGYAIA